MMQSVDTLSYAHGFFGRAGGVSTGIYQGLNCGLGSDDVPANVRENRSRVAEALGGAPESLFTAYQVHGAEAQFVTAKNLESVERPQADGLVTTDPAIVLGVLTADCCPILFEDKVAGVIGAAHAGWRGAASGITNSVVDLMIEHGASLDHITAAIGPTIHQKSYEVQEDMRSKALSHDMAAAPFFTANPSGSYQFDLPGYVRLKLSKKGITRIGFVDIDTYASADHYSYRLTTHKGEPDYGREVSAIRIFPK